MTNAGSEGPYRCSELALFRGFLRLLPALLRGQPCHALEEGVVRLDRLCGDVLAHAGVHRGVDAELLPLAPHIQFLECAERYHQLPVLLIGFPENVLSGRFQLLFLQVLLEASLDVVLLHPLSLGSKFVAAWKM